MCTSKNLVCKICTRKVTAWNECKEFNEYKVQSSNMDMQPYEFKWMRKHSITKPTKMMHEFVIVTCKSCEGMNAKNIDSENLMRTIARYANPYAGNFMIWIDGDNQQKVKWTKMVMTSDTNAPGNETESEIEPVIRSMDKNKSSDKTSSTSLNTSKNATEDEDGSDSDDDSEDDDSSEGEDESENEKTDTEAK
jgi:hypothetical protein